MTSIGAESESLHGVALVVELLLSKGAFAPPRLDTSAILTAPSANFWRLS